MMLSVFVRERERVAQIFYGENDFSPASPFLVKSRKCNFSFQTGRHRTVPPTLSLSLSLSVTQKNSCRKVLDLLKLLPHAELHSVENFLFGILPIGSQESLRTLVLITDDISNLHILEDNGGLEEKRNSTKVR